MRSGMRMLGAGVVAGTMMVSIAGASAQETEQPAAEALTLSAAPPSSPRDDSAAEALRPIKLSIQSGEPESVYAPPAPPREDEGFNEGAVHFDLALGYFSKYIYRGVEVFHPPLGKDRSNLQINSKLAWDLGKLPHPFLGVFANVSESDPVSTFQEIRPTVGFDWTIRPFIFSAGHISYLYPDRDKLETSEVYGQIQLDDSYFLHTDQPFLSPYIYAAYDYDRYNGWYYEAGISHKFIIEDTPLSFIVDGNIGYVQGLQQFGTKPKQNHINGFQHYQFGLTADYSLNTLFNVSKRYGDWSLQGFIYYTDGIDNNLQSTTSWWGGAGILFKY